MDKKKQKIYSGIALLALALLVVGATYAYFQNLYGESSQTDVKVTTYTTDLLTFETGDAINITADQESFAQGKSNRTGSSFAKAILQANSKTNVATANYYIYLNIESNEFTYTTTGKPELVFQVTDNSGNPVTSIDGLTYVTVQDGSGTSISGFDVTEKSGLITLVNIKEISASPRIEDRYDVTLVLVNYDFDQNNNAGKNFNTKLMIQKDEMKPTLADYVISQYTGTQGENGLYFHDSSLANGAGDNSYRYAGGDYVLTDAGKALGVTKFFSATADDTSGLIDFYCDNTKIGYAYYCDTSLTNYYLLKNDTTKYSSYNEVIKKANENGYIIGNQVNNYVCFGSTQSPCPTDNLYRIIGVFDGRAKLIKSDYETSALLGTDGDYKAAYSYDASTYIGSLSTSDIGRYMWNYNGLSDKSINSGWGSNTWSTSLLNKTNLNTNFITNIGAEWANKIDMTTWKVGGNAYANIRKQPAKTVYQNEIVNPVTTNSTDNKTEYSAKIGLMYASDYGFAAAPSAWTTNFYYYYDDVACKNVNWMYMGLAEWTISRRADFAYDVFFVGVDGSVSDYDANNAYGVRPVFFLSSLVSFASGSGTAADPILVN